jgi:hypothetical protein
MSVENVRVYVVSAPFVRLAIDAATLSKLPIEFIVIVNAVPESMM